MTHEETEKTIYEMHARVCSVLSSAKRLEVINVLRDKEKTVGELIAEMGVPKANLSQHLAVMRGKGLLVSRRDGQHIYYRLAYPKMLKAYDLLREVLFEHLERRGEMARRFKRKKP